MPIPTPTSGDLSLYFHLPFCEKKCDYCHFFVLPNKESYKEELLHALLKEIELKSDTIKKSKIQSIYFGGGTPALVGPTFIETLLSAINKHNAFSDVEITIELNPENHSRDLLKGYRSVGINRLSIGAQSFNDEELKVLSRGHSSKDTLSAIQNAKKSGFDNITIDLIYDLPNQTLLSWKKSVEIARSLPITHLSLYNLTIERETVFYKKRESLCKKMPTSALSLEMYHYAKEAFEKAGLTPYEISAFCKEGYHSRHNVGYWMQRNHLGFGPSAFSLMDGCRSQNVKNLRRYREALDRGDNPKDFSETLELEAFQRESLAIALRLYQGINKDAFQKRFGPFSKDLINTLSALEKRKWIEQNVEQLTLTDFGREYHDSLAEEIVL